MFARVPLHRRNWFLQANPSLLTSIFIDFTQITAKTARVSYGEAEMQTKPSTSVTNPSWFLITQRGVSPTHNAPPHMLYSNTRSGTQTFLSFPFNQILQHLSLTTNQGAHLPSSAKLKSTSRSHHHLTSTHVSTKWVKDFMWNLTAREESPHDFRSHSFLFFCTGA